MQPLAIQRIGEPILVGRAGPAGHPGEMLGDRQAWHVCDQPLDEREFRQGRGQLETLTRLRELLLQLALRVLNLSEPVMHSVPCAVAVCGQPVRDREHVAAGD